MKICSVCKAQYFSGLVSCPECGNTVATQNGFASFAPELEIKQEGFKPEFYETYAHLESTHFWFRARSRLINWALARYVPGMVSLLEIGCGTGYILGQVAKAFPRAKLLGSEMFSTGLRFAAAKLPGISFVQMDARDIPFVDEFEVIGAFDVIEHIEADIEVLSQMHRALKQQGIILLTVPQHRWLWSQVDEYSCHVRRYSKTELHRKVEQAGFSILRSTSFVSILLPAMMISRRAGKRRLEGDNETAELVVPEVLNFFFGFLMQLEYFFIKVGVSFPLGSSRFVIAKKKA